MNIFYLDACPQLSAQYMHDKHVVKMILETAQLLSTAHHVLGSPGAEYYLHPTHVNHPSCVWTRTSFNHYMWLANHGLHLCDEYTYRYGKSHKLSPMLCDLFMVPPPFIHKDPMSFTPPPQCMPDKYKRNGDTIGAYRAYYRGEKLTYKRGMVTYNNKWTRRGRPAWLTT